MGNRKYINILFYLFLLIYTSLLLYLAYDINIWEDEAYTLNTTSNHLAKVISESYGFEGQPPVYFILLAIWRLISPDIFFARLFSIVCIGLSAIVLRRIIPLISDLQSANRIIIIFLLNPFTVWAALEIRTYALLIFLSTFSLYTILLYYVDKEKKYLYYFLIACLIGLYSQYYFAFLIAAITLGVLFYYGWQAFFRLSLYLIPVLILFLPNFYFLPHNIENFQSDDPGYSIIQRSTIVITYVQNITLWLNLFTKIPIVRWIVRIVFIILTMVSYLDAYKNKNHKNVLLKYNFVIVVTILSIAFFVAFVFITGLKFNARYLAISYPLIILLFVIFNWDNVPVRNIIYWVFSIYFMFLLMKTYSVPVKTYDYESIAKFVQQIEKSNEPVLINSRTISTPFQYYYTGKNELVQLPDSFKLEKEGFQVLLRDTIDVKLIMESIESESFIFINDNMRGYSARLLLNSDILDNYLNTKYYVSLDTLVFGKNKSKSLRLRRLEYVLP